ncbi:MULTISPECIES: YlxR family protein [Synechococcus]|jgi:predicted RNA-binding protein YlxR (DUF448 family)|uniref:YlxR family protein n=1 Tax=Synechococcus TaxID=1129 RepID=UPI000E8CFA60|nr:MULTISPECIES: YlxR family protein [Synechococcus]MCP9811881.1 YlxR family protein [Synechococcus lacustris Maggiore-St4-Slac]MCP9925459.1 YlxR family protein [Synechococcus lacustris C3-12m-Tous]HBU26802.1 DUF448 domain-containing protein [Synechococcales bacterium UBA8138]
MATLRRCISCRSLVDRQHLWRVVRLAGGAGVQLDQGMGRSAYLCQTQPCLEDARKRRKLQRALRVNVEDAVYSTLAARLGQRDSAFSATLQAI